MRMRATLVVIFVLLGGVLTDARADEREAARAAFAAARDAFKTGQYEKALAGLQQAYKLKPHPSLLRYLGQTYYKLNRVKESLKSFQLYLKQAPKASDRSEVEARVRELEMVVGAADEEEKGTVVPPPAAVPPTVVPKPSTGASSASSAGATGDDNEVPEGLTKPNPNVASRQVPEPASGNVDNGTPRRTWLTVLKWTALGAGVGGLGAGIAMSTLATKKARELEELVSASNPTGKDPSVAYNAQAHDLQRAHQNFKTGAIAAWVVGGVASAAAITFFILDRPKAETSPKTKTGSVLLVPVVGAGQYGLHSQLEF
jgi:tetratricopeptide (TPR) repeat protein